VGQFAHLILAVERDFLRPLTGGQGLGSAVQLQDRARNPACRQGGHHHGCDQGHADQYQRIAIVSVDLPHKIRFGNHDDEPPLQAVVLIRRDLGELPFTCHIVSKGLVGANVRPIAKPVEQIPRRRAHRRIVTVQG
jgi:hypothetical protein